VEIHREILANGEDNLQTRREMLNLGQTNQSGLLQAEVDLQRDRLNLKQAANEFQHAWRTLVSLIGVPELAPATLTGTLEPDEPPLDWESAVSQVLSSSPELQAAWQKIRHDEITVERERVEPIPNLLAGVSVDRNFDTLETTTAFNVGIPLPIFDRNQGTVQQAQSDLALSHAESRRLELELRTRLALQYRDYLTAWQRVQDYESTMLPKAKNSYELLHESYQARRAAWPDVLMAQRLYLGLRTENLNNLVAYRESDVAIRGMLLTGGLVQPPAPVGGGHIDAVPKPR
jgi:cobalt-zinc-cadmium efflux system outer membrane protein